MPWIICWRNCRTCKCCENLFEQNGGSDEHSFERIFPPLQPIVIKEFIHTPLYKNKNFLHENYVEKGLSIGQISKMIFSSKEAVRNGLMKHGIEIREKSQHHGNPAQPKFGHRKVKKSLVDHKVEQKTIEAITQMKEEGLSLRAIARCLNQMKVPTKKRGKSWHPEMVRRILTSS
jgi:hypothetical protein